MSLIDFIQIYSFENLDFELVTNENTDVILDNSNIIDLDFDKDDFFDFTLDRTTNVDFELTIHNKIDFYIDTSNIIDVQLFDNNIELVIENNNVGFELDSFSFLNLLLDDKETLDFYLDITTPIEEFNILLTKYKTKPDDITPLSTRYLTTENREPIMTENNIHLTY